MPLSEHEQRILAELEESLTKDDPRFAKNVRETTVYSHSGRRVRWGITGFLLGLVILVWTFSSSVPAGLVGVVIMFGSAIVIERNLRRLGRASWNDLRYTRRTKTSEDTSSPRASWRTWMNRRDSSE